MDEKKQKKYLNKCLRVLKGKNSYKIRTFTDLAKAIKTSVKTFRFYNLNNIPEIKEILQKNRHENAIQHIDMKEPFSSGYFTTLFITDQIQKRF